jgi:DNA-binding transcriptional ArsR family regulator
MTMVCTVCRHEDRYQIDGLLADRSASYRDIARRFSLSKDAVSRHVANGHLSELVALAADAERAACADTLLDRIEALQRRTEEALTKAEEGDNPFATFRGISEMRRNLELIGEVTKELNRTPTLNLSMNPEYIAVRTAIVQAVEPYPEVREAISQAMLQLESEAREPNGTLAG